MAQSATMATLLLLTMMNLVSASTETSVIATKAEYTSRTQLEANTLNYGDSNVLEISTNSPRETTYYYMDDDFYCGFSFHYSSYTNFSSSEDDAYVEAWTDSSNRDDTYELCNYTFGSFVADNLKFRFESLKIHDCDVEIKIYLRPNNHGIPDFTYGCGSEHSYYSSYRYSYNGYLTIELANPKWSTKFDFKFHIQNIGSHGDGNGIIIGLSVGLSVVSILFLTVCVIACRRRQLKRRALLIVHTEETVIRTSSTAACNHSAGRTSSVKPNGYGSVSN